MRIPGKGREGSTVTSHVTHCMRWGQRRACHPASTEGAGRTHIQAFDIAEHRWVFGHCHMYIAIAIGRPPCNLTLPLLCPCLQQARQPHGPAQGSVQLSSDLDWAVGWEATAQKAEHWKVFGCKRGWDAVSEAGAARWKEGVGRGSSTGACTGDSALKSTGYLADEKGLPSLVWAAVAGTGSWAGWLQRERPAI